MLNKPTFAPLANFCTAEALIVECGLVSVTSLRWEGKSRANSRVYELSQCERAARTIAGDWLRNSGDEYNSPFFGSTFQCILTRRSDALLLRGICRLLSRSPSGLTLGARLCELRAARGRGLGLPEVGHVGHLPLRTVARAVVRLKFAATGNAAISANCTWDACSGVRWVCVGRAVLRAQTPIASTAVGLKILLGFSRWRLLTRQS